MASTQVADAAGIDKQRVYKAVDKGGLPAYQIGRLYRFRRDEVDAWLRWRNDIGKGPET